MAYDSPNPAVRHEVSLGLVTGVASAAMIKFKKYQKCTLERVYGVIQTAGTNASAGVDIYVGTTSVGAITLGTSTAGTELTSGTLNAAVADDTVIELRGKANSATMVAQYSLVFKNVHDAQVP